MNKSLNIFLVILLCVVLYVGLLFSFYSSKNFGDSNPHLGYAIPTGGGCGTYAVSADVSRPTGLDVAVPMSSRRSLSMSSPRMLGYGGYYTSQNVQYLGGTYNTQSPIAYMSSSQTMKSFGGGGNTGGVSMSGGVVSGNTPLSPNSFSVSLPNIPSLAYYPQSTASFDGVNPPFASSLSLPEVGTTSVGYGASAPLGLSGRRNASSMGGNLDEWVQGLINQYGWMYSDGTIDYFDRQVLEDLYNKAIENGELPVGVTWEMFLSWFDKQSDRYAFPIPSGVWFMCILALGYGLYVAYRRKQKVVNS